MTIAIGILCEGEIVFASDSQRTRLGDSAKELGVCKVQAEKIAGTTVLIALAGNDDNANLAIEILHGLGADKTVSGYRMIADLARDAMTEVRMRLKQQQGCDSSELQRFIHEQDQQTHLILGYYFQERPYLFMVDLAIGSANLRTNWATAGTGAIIGDLLLGEYAEPNMSWLLGVALALYVVEKAKKVDAYCSGATRLAVLRPPSAKDPKHDSAKINEVVRSTLNEITWFVDDAAIVIQSETDAFVSEILRVEEELKLQRRTLLRERFFNVTRDRIATFLADNGGLFGQAAACRLRNLRLPAEQGEGQESKEAVSRPSPPREDPSRTG